MPQLNPAPWLFILLFSWLIVLMIFKMKVAPSTQTNNPATPELLQTTTTHWNWPWT